MLDHIATKEQINTMVRAQRTVRKSTGNRQERAYQEARRWTVDWQQLAEKIRRSKPGWLVAHIEEPLTLTRACPDRPAQLTVLATDGSQLFPDRHEISSCYLINVGTIVIHYGTGERPRLDSSPSLFFSEEDLFINWGGKRQPVNAEVVGIQRSVMELSKLADLMDEVPNPRRKTVALSDGSLIEWTLEGKPDDFKGDNLNAILAAFDAFETRRIPVAGYISSPNSTDVVNALRVGLCPESLVSVCDNCPQRLHYPDNPPCKAIEGITDRTLFERILRGHGERSVLFGSSSEILAGYGRHRIYFFYVNVGYEIARVEVPEWVAQDSSLVGLVHGTVCDQVQKGKGYPIILSEAHEKAVVRNADRDLFYRLLSDSFVVGGVRSEVSRKSISKRRLMI